MDMGIAFKRESNNQHLQMRNCFIILSFMVKECRTVFPTLNFRNNTKLFFTMRYEIVFFNLLFYILLIQKSKYWLFLRDLLINIFKMMTFFLCRQILCIQQQQQKFPFWFIGFHFRFLVWRLCCIFYFMLWFNSVTFVVLLMITALFSQVAIWPLCTKEIRVFEIWPTYTPDKTCSLLSKNNNHQTVIFQINTCPVLSIWKKWMSKRPYKVQNIFLRYIHFLTI